MRTAGTIRRLAECIITAYPGFPFCAPNRDLYTPTRSPNGQISSSHVVPLPTPVSSGRPGCGTAGRPWFQGCFSDTSPPLPPRRPWEPSPCGPRGEAGPGAETSHPLPLSCSARPPVRVCGRDGRRLGQRPPRPSCPLVAPGAAPWGAEITPPGGIICSSGSANFLMRGATMAISRRKALSAARPTLRNREMDRCPLR